MYSKGIDGRYSTDSMKYLVWHKNTLNTHYRTKTWDKKCSTKLKVV